MGIRISTSTTRSITVRKPAGKPAKRADGACASKRDKALSVRSNEQLDVEGLIGKLVLVPDEEGFTIMQKTAKREVFDGMAHIDSEDERVARLFLAAPEMYAALLELAPLFREMHRAIEETDTNDPGNLTFEITAYQLMKAQKALVKADGMQLCLCGRAFHPQD